MTMYHRMFNKICSFVLNAIHSQLLQAHLKTLPMTETFKNWSNTLFSSIHFVNGTNIDLFMFCYQDNNTESPALLPYNYNQGRDTCTRYGKRVLTISDKH